MVMIALAAERANRGSFSITSDENPRWATLFENSCVEPTRPCGFYARVLEQGSPARVLIARYRETPPVCPLRCQRNHYHEGAERRRSCPLRNRISVCRALRKRSACLRALSGQGRLAIASRRDVPSSRRVTASVAGSRSGVAFRVY